MHQWKGINADDAPEFISVPLAYEYKSACTVPDHAAVLGPADGDLIEVNEMVIHRVVLHFCIEGGFAALLPMCNEHTRVGVQVNVFLCIVRARENENARTRDVLCVEADERVVVCDRQFQRIWANEVRRIGADFFVLSRR